MMISFTPSNSRPLVLGGSMPIQMNTAPAPTRDPFCQFRNLAPRLLLVVVALCYAGVSYANVISASHLPASWQQHAGEPSSAHLDHEHGDALPAGDDGSDGHQHGHDAADHSHECPNVPLAGAHAAPLANQPWLACLSVSRYAAPPFDFERPPKAAPEV